MYSIKNLLQDFATGINYEAYKFLGAHINGSNTTFRVWAPHAEKVYLVGDFNSWSETHQMKKVSSDGIYEITLKTSIIPLGSFYKYKIINAGKALYKADPYGTQMQAPPNTATVFASESQYKWNDTKYIEKRRNVISSGIYTRPLNIYEVNLSSLLKKSDGGYIPFREAAHFLASYAKKMGYTHIELMPVSEHSCDESFGYLISGYYAISSRFGIPDDFRYFIDTLHNADIGVILDWAPSHFPIDEHGLFEFDGEALYEYRDTNRQKNDNLKTRCFNLTKNEIVSFLISNAVYYAKEFHIDGVKVDSVCSMLYLDFDKQEEWTPNRYGGNISFEAVEFLKKLNRTMKSICPDVLMIADDSGTYKNVTSFKSGGLGFDLKWNSDFIENSLSYISNKHYFKDKAYTAVASQLEYNGEKYILPLSHDEALYGNKSLLDKMPGEYSEKFAGMRAYLTYMMTQNCKKLSFMSNEFGQFDKWDPKKSIQWFLLRYPMHRKLQLFSSELNHFYLSNSELWECDAEPNGHKLIRCEGEKKPVVAYNRTNKSKETLLTVINFSNQSYPSYSLNADKGSYSIVFSTDDECFGGTNKTTQSSKIIHLDSEDMTKLSFYLNANTAVILKKENTFLK